MSTSFDPAIAKDALKPANVQHERRVYDERVFMEVERFQLSRNGGDEWAIGRSITNPDEKLMVRLSTVEERMTDLPLANEGRLRQSYEGENRRETMAEKAQGKVRLIAFDGARPLGETEDGIKQYRAHWPQTMAAKPDAEVVAGLGSIVLYQPKEGSGNKADAYVEFLRTATVTDGPNVKEAMEAALEISDKDGNARDAHALMRVFYNGEEVATARVFPMRDHVKVVDPIYGDSKTVPLAVEGERSFQELRDGTPVGMTSVVKNVVQFLDDKTATEICEAVREGKPVASIFTALSEGQPERFLPEFLEDKKAQLVGAFAGKEGKEFAQAIQDNEFNQVVSLMISKSRVSVWEKNMNANNDLARAIVAGLMGDDEPPKGNVIEPRRMENFFHGAKGGDLHVEVVGVERIKFGVDSAKTYLKSLKDHNGNDNRKFTDYLVKTENEGKTITERGYGNTVVAFQRYSNGQPYAVYASPQENLPRVSPLAHFDSQMPLTSILPEEPKAAKSASNEMGM